MLDDIMINNAKELQEYCDDIICSECPFARTTKENKIACIIGMPAFWELKGVKKNDK